MFRDRLALLRTKFAFWLPPFSNRIRTEDSCPSARKIRARPHGRSASARAEVPRRPRGGSAAPARNNHGIPRKKLSFPCHVLYDSIELVRSSKRKNHKFQKSFHHMLAIQKSLHHMLAIEEHCIEVLGKCLYIRFVFLHNIICSKSVSMRIFISHTILGSSPGYTNMLTLPTASWLPLLPASAHFTLDYPELSQSALPGSSTSNM